MAGGKDNKPDHAHCCEERDIGVDPALLDAEQNIDAKAHKPDRKLPQKGVEKAPPSLMSGSATSLRSSSLRHQHPAMKSRIGVAKAIPKVTLPNE